MGGRLMQRQTWVLALALVLTWGLPQVALAQGAAGKVEGVVKDSKGDPVDGGIVSLQPATGRSVTARTNGKGQYSISVPPGDYTLRVSKGSGSNALNSLPTGVRVAAGSTQTADLVALEAAEAKAKMAEAEAEAKAAAATSAAFKTAFDAAVMAANAGNHDIAITRFTEAAAANPKCADCYSNLGNSYIQKKDYEKAEAAFLKSNEIKPNEPSYTGLASVYTAQRKMDQASAAMAKATELGSASSAAGAAGGGNADALFNQGVILWNGGKIAEAKAQFQAAVKANPNHAEAHYQLGMALVNEGNLAGAASEWNTYITLAPSGPHAAEVKAMLPSLK